MNETGTGDVNMTLMFAGVGAAVVFTFLWMAVVAITGVRYTRATKGGVKAEKGAMILWLVSLAGVFTGPLIVIFGLAGILGGLRNMRKADANPATRAAGIATLAHSSVMLLMIAVVVAFYAAAIF